MLCFRMTASLPSSRKMIDVLALLYLVGYVEDGRLFRLLLLGHPLSASWSGSSGLFSISVHISLCCFLLREPDPSESDTCRPDS